MKSFLYVIYNKHEDLEKLKSLYDHFSPMVTYQYYESNDLMREPLANLCNLIKPKILTSNIIIVTDPFLSGPTDEFSLDVEYYGHDRIISVGDLRTICIKRIGDDFDELLELEHRPMSFTTYNNVKYLNNIKMDVELSPYELKNDSMFCVNNEIELTADEYITLECGGELIITCHDKSDDRRLNLNINLLPRLSLSQVHHDGSNYSAYAKYMKCYSKELDIFFLSNGESYADENFEKIQRSYPRVKRIDRVKGIDNAHLKAAKESTTPYFFIIDADCELLNSFDLDNFFPNTLDNVYIWRAKNEYTGDTYGYGGVKCFSKKIIDIYKKNKENGSSMYDFTNYVSGGKLKVMPNISNNTRFAIDGYSAWKAAFREAVKLTHNLAGKDSRTKDRLNNWLNPEMDLEYSEYIRDGARAGNRYAIYNNDPKSLMKINDYDWLREKYEEYRKSQ